MAGKGNKERRGRGRKERGGQGEGRGGSRTVRRGGEGRGVEERGRVSGFSSQPTWQPYRGVKTLHKCQVLPDLELETLQMIVLRITSALSPVHPATLSELRIKENEFSIPPYFDNLLAHQVLWCHIDLSLGYLYEQDWQLRPGRPSNQCIDQLHRDNSTTPPADLWRRFIKRGRSGVTLRSSPTTC